MTCLKNLQKPLFFLIIILLLPELVIAHELIRGLVLNSVDNSPLMGAVVQIPSEKQSTISNEFGKFELSIESHEVEITVSFLGFKTVSTTVSQHDEQLIILLDAAPLALDQVSVGANRVNTVSTISKIDIELKPISSSQEVLRIIPGLFIAQHAGGGKAEQIFLRGFDTDHGTDINITVDGMPVNMVSHAHGQGYADLHFLIPELINTVDFGKGPYYTDKGNLATAGYAGFHTFNKLNHSEVKLEAGMFNTFRLLGMFDLLGHELKNKGQNAYMAAEYYSTDGPFDSPQNFNRINLFGKYTAYLDQDKMLSFQISNLSSKWDASGQIPDRAVKSGAINRYGAIDDTEGGYTGRTNLSTRLINNLNSGWVSDNQIFFSRYYFELYSNFTYYLNNPVEGDQIRQKEYRDIYGLNGSVSKTYRIDNTVFGLKTGYGFRYDDINKLELTNTYERKVDIENKSMGDVDETNVWLYLDGKIERHNWMLNLGLRCDGMKFEYTNHLDSSYSALSQAKAIFSPKLNLVYNLNERTKLYLKTGIGFHSNDTRLVVYEEGLEILPSAYGCDIGISFKPQSSIFIDIAAWYLFLEQEFVYVGDEAIVEPSGKSNRLGIDLSLRWQILSWLFADLDINYAYCRSIEGEPGENYLPLSPDWTSMGGFSFRPGKKISASLRYRYMKDRPANEDNSIVALGYFVADARINYRIKNLELGISIENLLNTEWNEAQFATESRLKDELSPVNDLNYTPGVPSFIKLIAGVSF